MDSIDQRQLRYCFKILSDATSLRMLKLLAGSERTQEELTALLSTRAPEVTDRLSQLRAAHLLNLRTADGQRFYRLNHERFAEFQQAVSHITRVDETAPIVEADDPSWTNDLPFADWEKKVLRDYTYAGRLRLIPAKLKKFSVVVKWLAMKFEPDVVYTQDEVNAIITRYHPDYATLRRALIDFKYLDREAGGATYWVVDDESAVPHFG